MKRIANKTLIDFLRARNDRAALLDKLKLVYRPLICPYDDLLRYADVDSRVFDIGCGRGQFALLLAEFIKPQAIGGIEISSGLVEKARVLLADYESQIRIDFQQYDGVHIPASIDRYDLVYLIDVVHHVPPDAQTSFIHELYRCMAPGSRLILKDIDAASPFVFANKLHDLVLAGEAGHELRLADMLRLVTDAGFSVIGVNPRRMLWYPHYTLVLSK